MSRNQLLILIACAVTIGVIVFVSTREKLTYEIPPPMTGDEITACADGVLLSKVANNLRYRIALKPTRWRTMGPEATTVLSLAWVEDEFDFDAPGHVFHGFAELVSAQTPTMATLDEIAAGYDAIGASEAASIVREAKALADKTAAIEPGQNPFGALDSRLREERRRGKTIDKLHAYIRAHSAELAAAKLN